MSYTVLARRYRSQSFADVVGQEPIARTLTSAITTDRVAHAYLFCGTRGVGKTSMARLFARALNAPDTLPEAPKPKPKRGKKADDDFPAADVQQRMADAIMRGEDLNVIEIDGASNRGIDQVRQLIINASLAPTDSARYKVYIIDEVHALTKDAFNALLKLLEEPPAHVKFILCTTEATKVLPTIQSRCQRFDFRNIPTKRIADHLRAVLEQESVKADDDVVWQIARLGNGSMRDALSLLDRLIATGDSPLTAQTIQDMFGLPDQQRIVDLVDALADGIVPDALRQTGELLNQGVSQDQLIDLLIERLRCLMLLSACGAETELVEIADDARPGAVEQAGKFDAAALTHMIALCENLQYSSKGSATPRALLDATIVRLALAEKMADVAALLAGDNAAPKPKKKAPRDGAESPALTYAEPTPAPVATTAPPTPEPTAPDVQVGVNDPDAIWAELCRRLADRPGQEWIGYLSMRRLSDDEAVLAPLPGGRDVVGFATADRLGPVTRELSELLGRRVRLRVETAAGADRGDAASADDGEDPDARRAAMDLPLVRRVLETFPDATVTSVRSRNGSDRPDSHEPPA